MNNELFLSALTGPSTGTASPSTSDAAPGEPCTTTTTTTTRPAAPILRIDTASSAPRNDSTSTSTPPLSSQSPEALSPTTQPITPRRKSISALFHRHHKHETTLTAEPAQIHVLAGAQDGSVAHYIPEVEKESRGRRFSQKFALHGHRSNRNRSHSSSIVPESLLGIAETGREGSRDGSEVDWEQRAAMLVNAAAKGSRGDHLSVSEASGKSSQSGAEGRNAAAAAEVAASVARAIELHERGDIVESTQLFASLARPDGTNNPVAQIFYGVAKRHGWGCPMDTHEAFHYLRLGASNATHIEEEASSRASKHGSKAKKTLGMAMYELGNCYRNAWGTPRDPVAARYYYEAAANLGDTDAMGEAAACFEKGIGGRKDKFQAARYYRLAEANGVSMTGMSWIHKPKYMENANA